MVLSTPQQLAVLLWSLLFGAGLGGVYDLLRVFRIFVRCPSVAVLFQDLFYFLFSAVASFLFIFEVNDGTVRLFILAAFLVGGLAFRFTVGQLLVRFCTWAKNNFIRRKASRREHKQQRTLKRSHRKQGDNVA